MTQTVVEVVVEKHTGYPADFIELDQDLEGELGIDTVKQAEIMADIRDRFGLPVDEDFVLADHPTLNHMIAYIQRMKGGEGSSSTVNFRTRRHTQAGFWPGFDPNCAARRIGFPHPDVEAVLVEVVVDHTGYPADFIEMDQDFEGELGIDTVKQAEIMAKSATDFHSLWTKTSFCPTTPR